MHQYRVHFITPSGKTKKTHVWAEDKRLAHASIRAQKCDPILIVETGKLSTGPKTFSTSLKTQEVISILDQLEMQIDSDIPIDAALRNLAGEFPDGRARFVVGKILEQVAAHGRVADAFAQFPRIFPAHVVQMIQVGHRNGELGGTFGKIVDHLNATDEIHSIVKKAMSYPIMAFSVILGVVIFLMGFVMPLFAKVFDELGVKLPWITRLYLTVGQLVSGHLWLVIGLSVLIPIIFWRMFKNPKTKEMLDHLWVRIPVVKDVIQYVVISRLTGNLAALYNADITIQEGIVICSRITGNIVYDKAIQRAVEFIGRGSGIGDALAETERFPGMMTMGIKIGENTGRLGIALEKAHKYYTRRSKEKIAIALQFLEPIMTLGMGIFVGSVAASLFYPLVTLAMNIKK